MASTNNYKACGDAAYFFDDHEQKLGTKAEEACGTLGRARDLTREGVGAKSNNPPICGRDRLVHSCDVRDGAGRWVVGKEKKGLGVWCGLEEIQKWEEW